MRFVGALAMVIALSLPSFAKAKPDFTGRWKLNTTESRYPDKDGVPTKMIRVVEHEGDSISYDTERELNGKTGKTNVDTMIGFGKPGDPLHIVWDGDILVVTVINKQGVKQTERWSLSADGKRITDQTTIQRPGGTEVKVLRIFDKQ